MKRVFVVAAGMTRFGAQFDISVHELARQAVVEALETSRIESDQVQAVFAGHAYQGPCLSQKVLLKLGMEGIPALNLENACASGATALKAAMNAICAGELEVALVLGAEKLTKPGGGFLPIVADDLDSSMGRVMPAAFAMIAQLHMRRYGTTLEQMASVSVKNRRNAVLNPRSVQEKETTVDEVLSSPMIADPITRNMCCPISDGAAAVVVASQAAARNLTNRPIEVRACVLNSGIRTPHGIVDDKSEMSIRAAGDAYRIAGIQPSEIDVCEMHDPFPIAELVHYEDLGFCAPGESGRMIEEGRTGLDGDVAVSPSGGLLGKGHPLGATGIAQIAELFWQLRGEAGARQVEGAKLGLAHVVGGGVTNLESGACAVTLLGA